MNKLKEIKIFPRRIFAYSTPINDFLEKFSIFEKGFLFSKSHDLIRKLPVPIMFK